MFESVRRLKNLDRKDIYPERIFAAAIRRIKNIPHLVSFYLPWGFPKRNRKRLEQFVNIHAGKRCFILANGPSLNKIDFDLLKGEYTIGMNRIYLMEEQNGFHPTYLSCIDVKSQILQFHDELDALAYPCFFNYNLRRKFSLKENQYFIKGGFSPKFRGDLSRAPHGNGKSVTYAAMHLAYMMGFQEVYLIGKDHSYNTTEKAGVGITSDGKEDNHFIKGYYKPGQNWDAPDYQTEEFAYRQAREAFEKDGRIIKDATIGGKLEVFEKVDFNSLFEDKK